MCWVAGRAAGWQAGLCNCTCGLMQQSGLHNCTSISDNHESPLMAACMPHSSATLLRSDRICLARPPHNAGASVMLGAAGYASSTFDLLRHEGWDAFLRAQEAQRRARRRLPWRRSKHEVAEQAGSQGGTPSKGGEAAAAAAQAGAVEVGEAGPPRTEEEREEREFLPQDLEAVTGSLRRVLLRAATLDTERCREMLRAFTSRGPLAFGGALVDFPELAAKQQEAQEREPAAAKGPAG